MKTGAVEQAIAERIATAQQRGQRITPWVRETLRSWCARGVRPLAESGTSNPGNKTYVELGVLPIPCDCNTCKGTALIFPPEEGAPTGYCLCPRCSFKPRAESRTA